MSQRQGQPLDRPRVGMEGENDWLVVRCISLAGREFEESRQAFEQRLVRAEDPEDALLVGPLRHLAQ